MANVTPGYSFTGTTDPITYTKLNLLGQPTVSIGSNEVVSSMIASGNTYNNATLANGATIGQAQPLYESYSTVTFGAGISLTFTVNDGNTRRIACTSNTGSTISVASVPRAGYNLTLSFTTDETGGNVITFNTSFRTTGAYTLTGSFKYYTIKFVSDGTALVEVSRSGAAA